MARPEKEPKTPLAKRLRKVRKALGDPERSEVAGALKVSVSTLAFYERGESEPTASVLGIYRSVYGVNSEWLLTGQGGMFADTSKATSTTGFGTIDPRVFKEVGRLVSRVHSDMGVKLPADAVFDEQSEAYNAIVERAENPRDTDELLSLLPWLEARLMKCLRAAKNEPGTGKRPA